MKELNAQLQQQYAQLKEVKQLNTRLQYQSAHNHPPAGRQAAALDADAAKIALSMQKPLFDILGHININTPAASRSMSAMQPKSEDEIEYEALMQTYSRDDVLYGLKQACKKTFSKQC